MINLVRGDHVRLKDPPYFRGGVAGVQRTLFGGDDVVVRWFFKPLNWVGRCRLCGVFEMPSTVLKLTEHFNERWEERVGGEKPSPGEVARMLQESIVLQQPRDLFTPRGRL